MSDRGATMFWRIKRWWLRRTGEYPRAYVRPTSPDNALSQLSSEYGAFYDRAISDLENSQPDARQKIVDDFAALTRRTVTNWGEQTLDVTNMNSTKKEIVHQWVIRVMPTRAEVGW